MKGRAGSSKYSPEWPRGSRVRFLAACALTFLCVAGTLDAAFFGRGLLILVERAKPGPLGWRVGMECRRVNGYLVVVANGPLHHDSGGPPHLFGLVLWWDRAWLDASGSPHPAVFYLGVWYWVPPAVFGVMSWLAWRGCSWHRQVPGPSCSRCGYDLRAHKPGDKCPECGTVIPEKPAAKES